MTAGSDNLNNNGNDDMVEKIGLAGNHAYSLLGVYELSFENGEYQVLTPEESGEGMKIYRLVKLRNPWGKGEWKGKWSDDSSMWTEDLKEKLSF